jgi:hypothetical protein
MPETNKSGQVLPRGIGVNKTIKWQEHAPFTSKDGSVDITHHQDGTVDLSANGGGGAVDSVNGQTGVVVLTSDDIEFDSRDETITQVVEDIEGELGDIGEKPVLNSEGDSTIEENEEPLITKQYADEHYSGGGGLDYVHHDDTLTGDGTTADPLSVVSGGGSDPNKVDKVSFDYDEIKLDFDTYEVLLTDGGEPMGPVTSVNGLTGDVVLNSDDIEFDSSGQAITPIVSNLLNKGVTASAGNTNLATLTENLVTKAYADEHYSGGGGGAVDSVNGQTGTVVLDSSDVKRHNSTETIEHALDNINENLILEGDNIEALQDKGVQASDSVTTINDNTENLVTKDYADAHYAGGSAVDSVNGETGAVVLDSSDIQRQNSSETIEHALNTINDNLILEGDSIEALQDKGVQASDGVKTIDTNTENLVTKDYADAHYSGGGGGDVNSVNGETGDVVLTGEDINYDSDSESPTIKQAYDYLDNKTDLLDNIPVQYSSTMGKLEDAFSNDQHLVSKEYADAHYSGGGGSVAWGSVTGNLPNQTDLVDYIAGATVNKSTYTHHNYVAFGSLSWNQMEGEFYNVYDSFVARFYNSAPTSDMPYPGTIIATKTGISELTYVVIDSNGRSWEARVGSSFPDAQPTWHNVDKAAISTLNDKNVIYYLDGDNHTTLNSLPSYETLVTQSYADENYTNSPVFDGDMDYLLEPGSYVIAETATNQPVIPPYFRGGDKIICDVSFIGGGKGTFVYQTIQFMGHYWFREGLEDDPNHFVFSDWESHISAIDFMNTGTVLWDVDEMENGVTQVRASVDIPDVQINHLMGFQNPMINKQTLDSIIPMAGDSTVFIGDSITTDLRGYPALPTTGDKLSFMVEATRHNDSSLGYPVYRLYAVELPDTDGFPSVAVRRQWTGCIVIDGGGTNYPVQWTLIAPPGQPVMQTGSLTWSNSASGNAFVKQ